MDTFFCIKFSQDGLQPVVQRQPAGFVHPPKGVGFAHEFYPLRARKFSAGDPHFDSSASDSESCHREVEAYHFFTAGGAVVAPVSFEFFDYRRMPNKSPEPTAVGACSCSRSRRLFHIFSRRWLSFFRYTPRPRRSVFHASCTTHGTWPFPEALSLSSPPATP